MKKRMQIVYNKSGKSFLSNIDLSFNDLSTVTLGIKIKLINIDDPVLDDYPDVFNEDDVLILVIAKKGSFISEHYHKEFKRALCIKGKCLVNISGVKHICDKGDILDVRGGITHTVRFLEDSVRVLGLF